MTLESIEKIFSDFNFNVRCFRDKDNPVLAHVYLPGNTLNFKTKFAVVGDMGIICFFPVIVRMYDDFTCLDTPCHRFIYDSEIYEAKMNDSEDEKLSVLNESMLRKLLSLVVKHCHELETIMKRYEIEFEGI